jgi:hypothetical protein
MIGKVRQGVVQWTRQQILAIIQTRRTAPHANYAIIPRPRLHSAKPDTTFA